MGGEHDDRERGVVLLERGEELHPVHPRHPQIADHGVVARFADGDEGLGAAGDVTDAVAGLLEEREEDLPDGDVVVDYQDGSFFAHALGGG